MGLISPPNTASNELKVEGGTGIEVEGTGTGSESDIEGICCTLPDIGVELVWDDEDATEPAPYICAVGVTIPWYDSSGLTSI